MFALEGASPGALIGRKGSHAKYFTSRTGAHLQFLDESKVVIGRNDDRVGKPAFVQAAPSPWKQTQLTAEQRDRANEMLRVWLRTINMGSYIFPHPETILHVVPERRTFELAPYRGLMPLFNRPTEALYRLVDVGEGGDEDAAGDAGPFLARTAAGLAAAVDAILDALGKVGQDHRERIATPFSLGQTTFRASRENPEQLEVIRGAAPMSRADLSRIRLAGARRDMACMFVDMVGPEAEQSIRASLTDLGFVLDAEQLKVTAHLNRLESLHQVSVVFEVDDIDRSLELIKIKGSKTKPIFVQVYGRGAEARVKVLVKPELPEEIRADTTRVAGRFSIADSGHLDPRLADSGFTVDSIFFKNKAVYTGTFEGARVLVSISRIADNLADVQGPHPHGFRISGKLAQALDRAGVEAMVALADRLVDF